MNIFRDMMESSIHQSVEDIMLENLFIVLEDRIIYGDVMVCDGIIHKIIEKPIPNHGLKRYLIPGFIDLHTHGSDGIDVMDAGQSSLEQFALALVKEGITAFLPTTMTMSQASIEHTLIELNNYYQNQSNHGAIMLGVHLEGPFINIDAAGAQHKSFIVNPSMTLFDRFNQLSGFTVRKVTLAPEQEGAMALIKHLVAKHVIVSLGHTHADYQTMIEAIKLGATSATHTYNAMSMMHHREIGAVGATLLHDELCAELILDKIHVSIPAAKLLIKTKGCHHITLITDSMRGKNMPDGKSEIGGQPVMISQGVARLPDGSLAGSTLRFIDAYKYALNDLNLSMVEASLMCSTNAAKALNVYSLMGSIEVGKLANLLILDETFNIEKALIKGVVVYPQS